MLRLGYWLLGGALVSAYAFAAVRGIEFGTAKREILPPDVRHAPGGYRAYHFWHSGYRGGK
jgi:hypothetical protein